MNIRNNFPTLFLPPTSSDKAVETGLTIYDGRIDMGGLPKKEKILL